MQEMMIKSIQDYLTYEAKGGFEGQTDTYKGCHLLKDELAKLIQSDKEAAHKFYDSMGYELIRWSHLSRDMDDDNDFAIVRNGY